MNKVVNVTPLRKGPESTEGEYQSGDTPQGQQTLPVKAQPSQLSKTQRKGSWRSHLAWFFLALAIAAAAVYFATPFVLGPVVATDVIKRQDVVQTIVASGLVQTPFRIDVASQVIGKVADVPVAEGQTVKAGDLLIQLDSLEALELVKLAQSVVMQSQSKLQQLASVAAPSAVESQIQAQANLATAERAFDRAAALQLRNYVSTAAVEEARRVLDIAQSQLRAAELQVQANSPTGTEHLMAEAQLTQAQASLNSAQAKLQYYQIRAPRAGIIIKRSVERGNVVQPGAALMILAPEGETQITVEIDEVNLSMLRSGQDAIVSADAYPKQNFTAHVSYINPSIDPQRGSVEIKLTVPNPPDYLRQDMTVSVEIKAAQRSQVVVVDTASIHDLSSAKSWVNVVENGHVFKREIKLGTIGDNAVEVIAGIKPGDIVVRSSATSLTNGQRVRVVVDE